ncbi:MAG: hypothetical protein ACYDH5_06640 [Acidimicrobiales bacterium]
MTTTQAITLTPGQFSAAADICAAVADLAAASKALHMETVMRSAVFALAGLAGEDPEAIAARMPEPAPSASERFARSQLKSFAYAGTAAA